MSLTLFLAVVHPFLGHGMHFGIVQRRGPWGCSRESCCARFSQLLPRTVSQKYATTSAEEALHGRLLPFSDCGPSRLCVAHLDMLPQSFPHCGPLWRGNVADVSCGISFRCQSCWLRLYPCKALVISDILEDEHRLSVSSCSCSYQRDLDERRVCALLSPGEIMDTGAVGCCLLWLEHDTSPDAVGHGCSPVSGRWLCLPAGGHGR